MLTPGGIFRHYQLLEQIGIGGQAVVWSALAPGRDRILAIKFNKILDSDQTRGEEIGIEQKLEKLVRLQHPHILPLQEYGSEEHVRFMVSPYVPGGTLAHRIKTAPLSFDQVLKYGSEIASALDYLHAEGVIHRDLKSSNILLDLSDHTYLADFGLARLVSSSTLAFHTGHGTPPYAPPEQIRSQEITLKSDIFSFGILLFEMFAGQLPWNNQRQLGVEQLHSAQELPDLREYVTGLPALVTNALRRVTSADPDLRPRSASEVMQMLYYVFKVPENPAGDQAPYDESMARYRDAQELIRHGLAQWESTEGRFNLGLTKFALIDLQSNGEGTEAFNRFMLSQSLTYGHNDDRWWATISNPRDRLQTAASLLGRDNEVIAARVLDHLTRDPDLLGSPRGLPGSMARALLATGLRTKDPSLRHKIFTGMQRLVRPRDAWSDPQFDEDQIRRLGKLAMEDSQLGDRAAELVGHLRAPAAVRVILASRDDGRKIDALLLIQRVAGGLPAFVPGGVRFRLALDWVLQRLTQQPINLVGAYMLAFLGASMSIFLQNYLTIRLPDFFNITRLTNSVERGLIIGSVFGFGIFFARIIMERFQTSGIFRRLLLSTLVGGVLMNIALLIFHVLFVRTPPEGFLITLGCLTIALACAVSSLVPSVLFKMVLVSISVFIAIVGTWLIHANFATSLVELTPMFKYEPSWPLSQILMTALLVSMPVGVFGSLVPLAVKEEEDL